MPAGANYLLLLFDMFENMKMDGYVGDGSKRQYTVVQYGDGRFLCIAQQTFVYGDAVWDSDGDRRTGAS